MSDEYQGMRKFIITSTDLDYMFELVRGNVVRRVIPLFDEQSLAPIDNKETFDFQDLPREIAYRVVKEYMKYLFKNANFDLAFDLLCIDRYFVNQMYYAIYGFSNITLQDKIKHLAWTFRAAMEIYDFMLTAPNMDRNDYYALMFEYFDGWNLSEKHPFYPWDFDLSTMQLVSIEPPLLEDGNWDVTYHAFHPGRNYGDTVWIQGAERKGIFRAVQTMRPVIPILLRDGRHNLLKITKTKESCYYFHRFAQFLRVCFGNDTRVFYGIDNFGNLENPFMVNYVFADALKCMVH